MNSESTCLIDDHAHHLRTAKGWWSTFLRCFRAELAVSTRKGSDGRRLNQDAVMVTGGNIPMVGVADGISKSNKGEIASRLAFIPFFLAASPQKKTLVDLAFASHQLVTETYRLFGETRVGCTTLLVAALRRGAVATVLSVGDSRAYVVTSRGFFLRRFSCRRITVDQVYGELKKRAQIEMPERYPDHVMFQSVNSGLLANEVAEQRVTIPAGGMLVLATDGLFKRMDHDCAEITAVAGGLLVWSAQAICEALVQRALELGSSDDISVAVILPSYFLGARWPFWCGMVSAIAARSLLA